MPDLERERMALIRRNQEMLAKLGVQNAVADLRKAAAAEAAGANGASAERRPGPARPKRAAPEEVGPARRSTRLAAGPPSHGDADAAEAEDAEGRSAGAVKGVGIMTQEEYLASKGLPVPADAFATDGHFRGWVAPDVVQRFGLAGSAAEAWEAGGGGQFKRKITKADVPAQFRSKGWSEARAFAAGQLHKNPNAFFYRHPAPDREQATGEWTQEEHDLFVQTARKHGVGDKWGLFASYIPNRVGYQCSAYYVQVIVPSGLILDKRYRMDAWGDAVFMGKRARDD
ncbi:hypothetical protein HYH03_009043 [Edaphochlamys debaryana]|uniref:Myb-like domain-containing protein n=1 Tax=Edaphochlamys debaryana TaxID=47281 RepID=A0A836BY51_9CHLO|nr:hypothetical protein HYH03_009043 [Edaphochlamys debaryana]|eukprot:KAG2492627.1 hypothetical protein HYH03_009043 [Edaphochlamys debaryana]